MRRGDVAATTTDGVDDAVGCFDRMREKTEIPAKFSPGAHSLEFLKPDFFTSQGNFQDHGSFLKKRLHSRKT